MNKSLGTALAFCAFAAFVPAADAEDDALVSFKIMKPETALALAQGALERCRREGAQVAVAVVDRFVRCYR